MPSVREGGWRPRGAEGGSPAIGAQGAAIADSGDGGSGSAVRSAPKPFQAQVADRKSDRAGVDRARPSIGGDLLQLAFDLVDGVAIEHVAQFGIAERRLELRVLDRQRLGPPLGQRRVAVVEVLRDVAEEEGCGERRGRRRIDGDHADAALAHGAQGVDQRRQVEQVAQASR